MRKKEKVEEDGMKRMKTKWDSNLKRSIYEILTIQWKS